MVSQSGPLLAKAQPPSGERQPAVVDIEQRAASAPVTSTRDARPAESSGSGGCGRPGRGQVEGVHGQLVRPRAHHGQQRQRSEHRAHQPLTELVRLRGAEERGGIFSRVGQGLEYVVARRIGMCLDDGLVVRVLVEVAAGQLTWVVARLGDHPAQ